MNLKQSSQDLKAAALMMFLETAAGPRERAPRLPRLMEMGSPKRECETVSAAEAKRKRKAEIVQRNAIRSGLLPARGVELRVFAGIVPLRISSGDVTGDPVAFQFSIDGKPIGSKLQPLGPKPWVYETHWDSRTVPDGTHVLSGVIWNGRGQASKIHSEWIEVRQAHAAKVAQL